MCRIFVWFTCLVVVMFVCLTTTKAEDMLIYLCIFFLILDKIFEIDKSRRR